jgi:hypothetical protein
MSKRKNIKKVLPVGDKRDPYGWEVRFIDFQSPWSREGGPEVTSKFFLRESDAKEYSLTLGNDVG